MSAPDTVLKLVESIAYNEDICNSKFNFVYVSTQGEIVLEKHLEITDLDRDRMVYELYGLTEEEIRIVEGA